MTGCSTSTVVGNLQLAVDALSAALPLIAPAGLPPALLAEIQAGLSDTGKAISAASGILANATTTDAEKAAAIAAAFAGIVEQDQYIVAAIPAQYRGIANAVTQIAEMVAQFLSSVPGKPVPAPTAISAHVSVAPVKSTRTKFSHHDLTQLAGINAKAAAAVSKLAH